MTKNVYMFRLVQFKLIEMYYPKESSFVMEALRERFKIYSNHLKKTKNNSICTFYLINHVINMSI